jgi:flagellar biogenesis protein FliO
VNALQDRKRLVWLAVIAGVLVLSLLFVSLMAPSAHPGEESDSPILRPQSEAAATAAGLTDRPAVADTAAEPAGFSMSGGEAFSLAWRLALVAVIIAVSIAGLRWWGKRTSGPRSVTGFIRVIDTLAISNGRTIHLVALGDRVIAVGATAQQLTLLNELSDEEAAAVLAALPQQPQQPIASFAAELFQSMRGSQRPHGGLRRDIVIGGDGR